MAIITLKNSFHNTETNVRGPWNSQSEAWEAIQGAVFFGSPTRAEKRRYAKVWKALCGSSDCTCGVVRS
jgi:hypothetical protein